jgi:hypothetical protein
MEQLLLGLGEEGWQSSVALDIVVTLLVES